MLTFKKAEICDADTLADAFSSYEGRICDFSLGNVIFWRNYYKTSFYAGEDGIILKFDDMDSKRCYSFPISCDPLPLVDELLATEGGSLCITLMSREQLSAVQERYKVKEVIHSPDWDDYVYSAEDIVTLKGRRYNGQRNHINKFKKCYPDATFEVITEENLEKANDFCERYFDVIGKRTEVSDVERTQLIEQLDNWVSYRQLGGMLCVGENVVGISVGEIVGDTLIIHTEKADTSYAGAYPMLTNCFAREFASAEHCKYINREEDCGEEGLRIAKLSYHPAFMLEKYAAIIEK